MQAGHVTPANHGGDPDIAWLQAQHDRDALALEHAADRLAE